MGLFDEMIDCYGWIEWNTDAADCGCGKVFVLLSDLVDVQHPGHFATGQRRKYAKQVFSTTEWLSVF